MAGKSGKFGRKQEEAIAALLTQRNLEEAARAAGIGIRTLLRWLQIPEFQAAYRKARSDVYGQAVARMHQASSAAVSTIMKLMLDTNVPASVRLRAAEILLERTAKSIEVEDIEARLAALERSAELVKKR